MNLCEHHYCRCMRAAELAAMSDRTRRGSLMVEAVHVHSQQVQCRMPPEPKRPGPQHGAAPEES